MKKIIFVFVFLLFSLVHFGQQSTQYSQFMLNDYGLNPAVAGAYNGLTCMIGRRLQWRGFEQAPTDEFANITYAFGKKGYKYYWHGVGAYVEQDKFGVFTNKKAYVSYAIHMKASPKYRFSFGIAAGIKAVGLSNLAFSNDDPALLSAGKVVIIPDVIPGLFLYSKKLSIGLTLMNLYKNRLKQGTKTIGSSTGSKLRQTTYLTISRKIITGGYTFVLIPSIHAQYDFTALPSVNFNLMTYYKKRVGLGISYRMHDALTAIVQVRIWKNVVVGFAYDYSISRFRKAAPFANSYEFMLGISPVMDTEQLDKQSTNSCPKFEI